MNQQSHVASGDEAVVVTICEGADILPLMAKIRDAADIIRYICTFTDSYGQDAWTKRQLIDMLDEVKGKSENILELTGVVDLQKHYEEVWSHLIEGRGRVTGNGLDWEPYVEVEVATNA